MKLEYRRDIQKRYMILSPDRGDERMNYQMKMLLNNEIPGFAKCTYEYMNGSPMLYYDISGFQPFSIFFGEKKADKDFFRRMVAALLTGIAELGKYMVDPETVLLTPGTVFTDHEGEKIKLVSFPFEREKAEERFRSFSGFMFSKAAEDAESVKAAFGFYTACCTEGVNAGTLLQVLRSMNEKDPADRNIFFTDEEAARKTFEEPDVQKEEIPEKKSVKTEGRIPFLEKFQLAAGKIKSPRGGTKKRKGFRKKKRSGGWQEYKKPLGGHAVISEDAIRYERSFYGEKEYADGYPLRHEHKGPEPEYGETVCLDSYDKEDSNDIRACLIPEDVFSEEIIELKKRECVIGRGISPDIINIGIREISRKHALFTRKGNTYEISDLGSKNGTHVNGSRLAEGESVALAEGDTVRFADAEYRYHLTGISV